MAQTKANISITDFESFTRSTQQNDQVYELINGEILEVPSNPYASAIANLVSFYLRLYLQQNNLQGHITGADGGYIINGDVYAPDAAYLSYERQRELPRQGFNPVPPELAIEVISDPHNAQEQITLRRKVVNYLAAGVLVWVINPEDRTVDVYAPARPARQLTENDTLSGEDVLRGFMLPVRDLFPPTDAS